MNSHSLKWFLLLNSKIETLLLVLSTPTIGAPVAPPATGAPLALVNRLAGWLPWVF